MKKILRVLSTSKKYGGDLFEDDIQRAWEHDGNIVQVINPVPDGVGRFNKIPTYFENLVKLRSVTDQEFLLRAMNHSFFIKKSPKQLVIAYHYDTSFCDLLVKVHHYLTLKSLILNKNSLHKLIVISSYWRDFFFSLGFHNIETIYCGFNLKEFDISDDQVRLFREKYQLNDKKIIYIGNSQRKKGAEIVFNQLKDLKYLLVTSGNKDIDLPCLNLNLNRHEYLCLLKASSAVITYSQFKEGWNRVAHEAMLFGVPVIGSGLGGMGELLKGGHQRIVLSAKDLKSELESVLQDREIGLRGKEFASSFTMDKFNKSCLQLLES